PGSGDDLLPVVGLFAWRRDGEHHQWNPETISLLQHAVRSGKPETYEAFSRAAVDAARPDALPPSRAGHSDPGGRAGGRDREALLHRCDVARLDLARGAR